MNKFREKIIMYLNYLHTYSYKNLVIFLLLLFSVASSHINADVFLYSLLALLLLSPVFIIHLIVSPYENMDIRKSKLKDIIKLTITKALPLYLKASLLTICMLILTFVLVTASNLFLYGFALNKFDKNMGSYILFFGISFLAFQSFTIFFNIFPTIVLSVVRKSGVWQTIAMSFKFGRLCLFKHILSCTAGVFMLAPILMVSDMITSVWLLSYALRVLYMILLINYIIFDIKDKEKDLDSMRGRWSKFKSR